MRKTAGRGIASYIILGLLLWPWPLLRILHVESAAIIAFSAFFIAGLSELPDLRSTTDLKRSLVRQITLLVVPWLLLTITVVATPNCAYVTGLVYFVLFTVPSAVLGVSVSYLVSSLGVSRPRLAVIFIGLLISVAGPIYDLGLHPQFYTFNHVFGGVMGPIYDEEFDFRWGLIPFRILTFTIIIILILTGRLRRLRHSDRSMSVSGTRLRVGLAAAVALASGIYIFSAPLGINSSEWYIRQQLGTTFEDAGIVLYFDSMDVDSAQAGHVANTLQYHRSRLDSLFGPTGNEKIHVYLYPDPFTRERLTGARFTNVAPVWLSRPQMHVLSSESRSVLTHELVHIYARDFGLPIINASPSVGLVEGLAVALEAPGGGSSVHDQVLASLVRRSEVDRQARADAVADRMSPLGFWSARGAVSYASAGSFTDFLIHRYGAERIRRVYRDGRFERAYGKSLDTLGDEWLEFLDGRRYVSAAAGPTSRRRFSVPSVFERRCPHHTPPPRRRYLKSLRALAARDTLNAIREAQQAWDMDSSLTAAASVASQLYYLRGDHQVVTKIAQDVRNVGAGTALRIADAKFLTGHTTEADSLYNLTLNLVSPASTEFRAGILLRRRLLDRPIVLNALLQTSDHDIPGAQSYEDSLAAALVYYRREEYELAVPLTDTDRSPEPLNEEIKLLDQFRLQIRESALYRSGRAAEAAESAGELLNAALSAGDIDLGRVADYRRSFYLWLAAREDWDAHRHDIHDRKHREGSG